MSDDSSSDSSGGGLGGDAGVGNDGGSLGGNTDGPGQDSPGPDLGGWGGPDTVGQNPNSSLSGPPSVDASSFYSQNEISLPAPQATPSLIGALRGAIRGDMREDAVVASVGLAALTAAMPAVAVFSTLTDIARALGLSEEPTSFVDNPEGGGSSSDPPVPGGNPMLPPGPPSTTVNLANPVFLTTGGPSAAGLLSTFAGPQGPAGDSASGSAAPPNGAGSAGGQGTGDQAPLWPAIAALALALVAA